MLKKVLMIVASLFLFASEVFAALPTAPVTGFVRNLGSDVPVVDAVITVFESGEKLRTNKAGKFGPIHWPIGMPITLIFEKLGYRTTQTASIVVPPEGLTSRFNNVTFQAINLFTFALFAGAMGAEVDESKCHVIATVTGYHKTMDDLPQGEAHVKVALVPGSAESPYYFDIFNDGPLKNYTNPFTKGLRETSLDGGVVFANVEPRDVPYTMVAHKSGVALNAVQFLCRKGVLINLSPPQGPSVQK